MLYPTVPLRGTPFIRNMKRMGQAATNRLLTVRISSILNRLLIDEGWNETLTQAIRALKPYQSPPLPSIPSSDKAILDQVRQSPTPEELEDLSIIDTLFVYRSVPSARFPVNIPNECPYAKILNEQWINLRDIQNYQWDQEITRRIGSGQLADVKNDPFFCTPLATITDNYVIDTQYGVTEYFKLSPSDIWGVEKPYVNNAIAVLTALDGYPFPSPIPIMPTIAYWKLQDDLVKLVHSDIPLTPYAARIVITLLTLQKYDEISEKIMDELKEKEKRQKWKSIVKKVGLSATLAVIGAGIVSALTPVAGAARAGQIAQGVKAVTGYTISSAEQRQAASDAATAAQLFETSDAGYAAELNDTANVLDQVAADQVRNGPISDELRAALEELGLNPPLQPSDVGGPFYPSLDSLTSLSTETLLIAAGAVVVAGVIVYALLA